MNGERPRVVHAVTSALSLTLMRGQLGHLQRHGFDVTVICSRGREVEAVQQEGVAVVTVSMRREISPFHDLLALWQLYRVLRQVRPDLVNAGTPKAGLLVGVAAWLAGVPHRVFTLRGLRSETATGWKRRLLLGAERLSCRLAERVICVSASLRQRASELGLAPQEKMTVLRSGSSNGVDAARLEPTAARLQAASGLRRRLGIPEGAPVIGFVGRFTRDKGIAELLAAFRRLKGRWPNLVLLLVGEEEPGDPPAAEVAAAIRSEAGVVVTGWVDDASLHYLLMDVLALPTYREGFPNTVLEAQAAGKPVVTTRATGAVDSIEDGVTGILVLVGDVGALGVALHKILEQPELAARMGAAGRERVLRDFRREPLWDALADLYRAMLGWGAACSAGSAAQGHRADP